MPIISAGFLDRESAEKKAAQHAEKGRVIIAIVEADRIRELRLTI